jgi:hypothetical protein
VVSLSEEPLLTAMLLYACHSIKTGGLAWTRVSHFLSSAVNHWGYFIYLNWMPTYFYKVLGEQGRLPFLLYLCGFGISTTGRFWHCSS